ncbi:hypothetical protein DRJ17_01415 [Candidatus Woesearchaeota archaeon]|nr:MAG: hypothetical protein DRJ17_01415 [Candidatus Woesearchaeota archaeon]
MRVLEKEGKSKRIKLDKKDKEILAALCKNARIPLSKIGNLVGLSREAVEYRIKRLSDAHVIVGSRTLINIRKLNHFSFHVFISLHNPKDEPGFLRKLKENQNVNAVIKYSGKWDFEVSIMTKTPEDFYDIYNELLQDINIQDEHILILLNTIKGIVLPNKFLEKLPKATLGKNDFSFHKEFNSPKKNDYKIDRTDLKIMRLLANNANIKIKNIADKVELSPDAITYRIKKLITNGYIVEFRPVIDYYTLNLSIQALLIKTVCLTKEEERKLSSFLKCNDSVLWCTRTFGAWDVLMYIITSNQKEFHEFINELRTNFGNSIRSYEALFAYQEYKYTFLPEGINI